LNSVQSYLYIVLWLWGKPDSNLILCLHYKQWWKVWILSTQCVIKVAYVPFELCQLRKINSTNWQSTLIISAPCQHCQNNQSTVWPLLTKRSRSLFGVQCAHFSYRNRTHCSGFRRIICRMLRWLSKCVEWIIAVPKYMEYGYRYAIMSSYVVNNKGFKMPCANKSR
jgi:hypothetical protein